MEPPLSPLIAPAPPALLLLTAKPTLALLLPLSALGVEQHFPCIEGMERGMVGQCLGEQRNILIPPDLAFDDRSLNFKQKPVPDGTTILYQVRAICT